MPLGTRRQGQLIRRLSADYEGWSEGYNSLRVCHGCSRMRRISRRV